MSEELQKQCEEYLAGWKRALADYDNLKKESARQVREAAQAGMAYLAEDILSAMDHLDAAMKSVKADEATLKGLRIIQGVFDESLNRHGFVAFGAVGDDFDANVHDAVSGDGTVVSEIVSRGWKLGDRLIRPAKVIIGK